MALKDGQDDYEAHSQPAARPWGAPKPEPSDQPQPQIGPAPRRWARLSSVTFLALVVLLVGARAYKDLSRPEAWAYWKDLYLTPSMTSSLAADIATEGPDRQRSTLAISGKIGAATASWFRDRLDEAHLKAGDVVLMSSPGGDLNQALIMGEIIRARGLATAVGVIGPSGQVGPSYCASACVLAYAGGKTRIGIEGSVLGVHRFVTLGSGRDPVADTQRTTGMLLGFMTRMGVSSTVVEAMSATDDIRWLNAKEAAAMSLVTDPVRRR